MGNEDENSASGGKSLMDQARASVNKQGKDAVIAKLKANFAKRREHEIAINQAKRSMELLDEENEKAVEEYEAGLV